MLPRELLKRIRKIEIATERLVRDRLAGQYHSVFKGRGMAFSEVRQYQPGDDIRLIDWNVTARMNDTYVKVFTEERELTVMLLVDVSASGRSARAASKARAGGRGGRAAGLLRHHQQRPRRPRSSSPTRSRSSCRRRRASKHVLRVVSEIL